MVVPAFEAVELLEKEGFFGGLINARFVKPLDGDLFKKLSSQINYIFTVEEGILEGGFGSAVMEIIDKPTIRIGLPSEFIPHGKRELLLDKYNLIAKAIRDKIKSVILSRQ